MYPTPEYTNDKNNTAVETRILNQVFISMNSYYQRMTKIYARLNEVNVRAFGPVPENGSTAAQQPHPAGSVGEIQLANIHIEEMLSYIEDALSKVERIA